MNNCDYAKKYFCCELSNFSEFILISHFGMPPFATKFGDNPTKFGNIPQK